MLAIHEWIVQLRQRLKLTQTDLATELMVARSTVARWEAGLHQPSRIYVLQMEQLWREKYEGK